MWRPAPAFSGPPARCTCKGRPALPGWSAARKVRLGGPLSAALRAWTGPATSDVPGALEEAAQLLRGGERDSREEGAAARMLSRERRRCGGGGHRAGRAAGSEQWGPGHRLRSPSPPAFAERDRVGRGVRGCSALPFSAPPWPLEVILGSCRPSLVCFKYPRSHRADHRGTLGKPKPFTQLGVTVLERLLAGAEAEGCKVGVLRGGSLVFNPSTQKAETGESR